MQSEFPFLLGARRFDFEDQLAFGRISGDVNPIHVDPLASRRSVVGAMVVHGVHTLLWALGCLADSKFRPAAVTGVDVRFVKPVYLVDEVELSLQQASASEIKLRASVGAKLVAAIQLQIASAPAAPAAINAGGEERLETGSAPVDCVFETAVGTSGDVDFAAKAEDFQAAFPGASSLVGALAARGLAACSRLVGMDCPGLRSIFARLTVTFDQSTLAAPLSYHVDEADARFRLLRISVSGTGLTGRIEALAPPAPPQQLSMSDAASDVGAGEFADQTALVIGGSRGLGETTAKLIAAGGGKVLLSYAVGEADANRIAGEIRAFGGEATVFRYDVTKNPTDQLTAIAGHTPTHVYYFATCRISTAKTAVFEPELLDRFMQYYNYGFLDICLALKTLSKAPLKMFYPSTVFIESRPREMTEYAMAKAAGEVMCADLPAIAPGVKVVMCRLPRLATDQTATISAIDFPSTVSVMLPVLKEMAAKA